MPSSSVYPAGIVEPISPKVHGRSFFPGGCGLFDGAEQPLVKRPVMLVGQDFGTRDYWNELGTNEEPADGTWFGVEKLLAQADIDPRRCFFTNALLGVRVSESMEGPSPGLVSPTYVDACMAFVREQVRILQPSVVVTLGVVPTMLLARELGVALSLPRPTPSKVLSWGELDAAAEPFVHGVRIGEAPAFALASSVHPVRFWLNAPKRSWVARGFAGAAAHEAVWHEVRSVLTTGTGEAVSLRIWGR